MESNIVSIFDKVKAPRKTLGKTPSLRDNEHDFAEAIKRNEKTQEKLRQERLKANESVLRSYRIKK